MNGSLIFKRDYLQIIEGLVAWEAAEVKGRRILTEMQNWKTTEGKWVQGERCKFSSEHTVLKGWQGI